VADSCMRSDAERILYAVIDGETGFQSVEDVRAFIVNEWQASKSSQESAQSALVVEEGQSQLELQRLMCWANRHCDSSKVPPIFREGYELLSHKLYERIGPLAPGWLTTWKREEWGFHREHLHISPASTTTGSARLPDPVSEVVARLEKERDEWRETAGRNRRQTDVAIRLREAAEARVAEVEKERDVLVWQRNTAYDQKVMLHDRLERAEDRVARLTTALTEIADIWHNKDAMNIARAALAVELGQDGQGQGGETNG